MNRRLLAWAVATVFLALLTTIGNARNPAAFGRAVDQNTPPPQATDADKKFAEITRSGRQSEQVKLLPQMEQFLRDYPDYPEIERVYTRLLTVLARAKSDPVRLQTLADEALTKFPAGQYGRWAAYNAKFSLLEPGSGPFEALVEQILKRETNAFVLQSASRLDKARTLPLLEKAIAERPKQPDTLGLPRLDELQWELAQALEGAGRTEEAVKLSIEVIDADRRTLAGLESARNGPRAKSLAGTESVDARMDLVRETLADRCAELVPLLIRAGQAELAVKYVGTQERAALPILDRRPELLTGAVQAYEKLGKPDLALDALVRGLAVRLDPRARDAIAAVARRTGKKPEDVYRRAAEMRNRAATPAFPFALVTDEGEAMKLADLKAKVVLLSFFFPT